MVAPSVSSGKPSLLTLKFSLYWSLPFLITLARFPGLSSHLWQVALKGTLQLETVNSFIPQPPKVPSSFVPCSLAGRRQLYPIPIPRSIQGVSKSKGTGDQNCRMLPDLPNALHILDGPDQRYFLGLVDMTTVYGFRKRLEHVWKMVRYPGQSVSTVSPAHYARRLCRWAEVHTE
jgi:hypothetical protein